MASYSRLPTNLRHKTLVQLGVCKSNSKPAKPPTFHRARTFHLSEFVGEGGLVPAKELSAAINESEREHSIHPADRRIRTSTKVPAMYFVACASIFFLTGIISVYTNTRRYGDTCIGIERGQFHIVAQLTIGKQQRRIRMLVRTDVMINCDDTPPMVITKRDAVISSPSAKCDSGSNCKDIFTIRSNQKNDLMLISYKLGVQELDGYTSYNLGLDGEIYMCLGSKYLFDEQQMCWSDDLTTKPELTLNEYHETLEFNLKETSVNTPVNYTKYNFMTKLCEASKLSIIKLPDYCVDLPDEDYSCSSSNDQLEIMPIGSSNSNTMVGMTTNEVVSYSSSEKHLRLASAGSSCSADPEYGMYIALCIAANSLSNSYSCNFGVKTIPFITFSRLTLLFDSTNWTQSKMASISIAKNIALEAQPLNDDLNIDNEWTTATWPTIRLLIMVLAAAVVYIREEDSMEKNDRLFVSCIRLILDQTSMTVHSTDKTTKRVNRAIEIEDQSQILGILAILSRGVVVISLSNSWWKSGLMRVVIIQTIATLFSLVHWILTHSQYADRFKRLALGGSSAIIDVSCAIILAYSTPPIRADLDKFNTIARLLTCALIVITCPTRCFFSSACAGIIYGVESFLIALFWIIQSISIANVIVDLFAVPASIDMMRSYTGTWTAASFSIFGTLLSICGPRLTANAVAITTASVQLKTVPKKALDLDSEHGSNTK